MVDVKVVNMGSIAWLIALFVLLVTQYIFPMFLNLLYVNDTIDKIFWLGIIIIWGLVIFIVPSVFYIFGLKKDNSQLINILGIAYAIIHFLVSVILIYLTYYMHSGIISLFNYDILILFYWISLIMVFVFNVIVIPFYIIMKIKNE